MPDLIQPRKNYQSVKLEPVVFQNSEQKPGLFEEGPCWHLEKYINCLACNVCLFLPCSKEANKKINLKIKLGLSLWYNFVCKKLKLVQSAIKYS